MNAVEELRRLLDERGVERFDGREGTYADDAAFLADVDGTFNVTLYERTPAQAVEAAYGRGTCRIMTCDNLNELGGDVWLECDACHWQMDYADAPLMPLNFCPNCGREVVDDEP